MGGCSYSVLSANVSQTLSANAGHVLCWHSNMTTKTHAVHCRDAPAHGETIITIYVRVKAGLTFSGVQVDKSISSPIIQSFQHRQNNLLTSVAV